jgi:hypothetical protein
MSGNVPNSRKKGICQWCFSKDFNMNVGRRLCGAWMEQGGDLKAKALALPGKRSDVALYNNIIADNTDQTRADFLVQRLRI